MNILGIYPATIGHDSNAALVKDGKLIAAVEEERFVRIKHTKLPPVNSVKFCLERAGLSLEDIDFIAVPLSPYLFARRSKVEMLETVGRFGVATTLYLAQKLSREHGGEKKQGGGQKEIGSF